MKKYIRGLVLVIVIAMLSTILENLISAHIQLEKLTIGIVLGIAYSSLIGSKDADRPGVQFALKRLLKWGIVLLGFKLNFLAVATLGPKVILIIIFLIPTVLFGAQKLGSLMGLNKKVSTLIGIGSSICGASAIVAMSPVIVADDDDSILAVSIISFLGAIGVIAYSSLALIIDMSDIAYGVWSGLSLQGVAHAISAAFAKGNEAGEIGTIVKMTRVMMLAPVSVLLSAQFTDKSQRKKVRIPGYVLLFICAGIIGSLGVVPAPIVKMLGTISSQLILAAMIAMGLVVDLKQIRKTGLKVAIHGFVVFITISFCTFGAIKWIM